MAEILTTGTGIEFVRTPSSRFDGLIDFPYEPNDVTIDGLRMVYVDEGPRDAPVVFMLHGEPAWSYLYRHMIPLVAAAGFRSSTGVLLEPLVFGGGQERGLRAVHHRDEQLADADRDAIRASEDPDALLDCARAHKRLNARKTARRNPGVDRDPRDGDGAERGGR